MAPGLGINPFSFGYQNQIGFNDYMDLDGIGTSYANPMMGMNYNPMMSMNGSLFGGMNGWYQNMDNYQSFMVDSQKRQQQRVREADISINAPEEGVKKQAALLMDKIQRNEQEQIQKALDSYVDSVKTLYPNAGEDEVFNRAGTLFYKAYNITIPEAIREHGSSSLVQGLKQSAGFGIFADKITAEENISNINNQPVGRWEKTKKTTGNILGGAVIGGTTFMALNWIKPIAKFLGKSRTFWGVAIGAGLATVASIAGATSKN